MTTTTKHTNQSPAIMSIPLNMRQKDGRIKYGSKKDWQFSIIEKNYKRSNADISCMLGCSVYHVTRLKREWRQSGRMEEFFLEQFMDLYHAPEATWQEKFRAVSKVVTSIIERSHITKEDIQSTLRDERITRELKAYHKLLAESPSMITD